MTPLWTVKGWGQAPCSLPGDVYSRARPPCWRWRDNRGEVRWKSEKSTQKKGKSSLQSYMSKLGCWWCVGPSQNSECYKTPTQEVEWCLPGPVGQVVAPEKLFSPVLLKPTKKNTNLVFSVVPLQNSIALCTPGASPLAPPAPCPSKR